MGCAGCRGRRRSNTDSQPKPVFTGGGSSKGVTKRPKPEVSKEVIESDKAEVVKDQEDNKEIST